MHQVRQASVLVAAEEKDTRLAEHHLQVDILLPLVLQRVWTQAV